MHVVRNLIPLLAAATLAVIASAPAHAQMTLLGAGTGAGTAGGSSAPGPKVLGAPGFPSGPTVTTTTVH